MDQISHLIEEGKIKANELNVTLKTIEHITSRLQHQFTKAQNDITDTFNFYLNQLEQVKTETLKELDVIYNSHLVNLSHVNSKVHDGVDTVKQIALLVHRFKKFSSCTELLFFKQLIEARIRQILNFDPELNLPKAELEFISNYQAIQASVKNTYGYIRTSSSESKQPPISRPNGVHSYNQRNGLDSLLQKRFDSLNLNNSPLVGSSSNDNRSFSSMPLSDSIVTLYDKWSIGGFGTSSDSGLYANAAASSSEQFNPLSDSSIDFDPNMLYNCKFE